MWLINWINDLCFKVCSYWGPPVNYEASLKARAILDRVDHWVFYWESSSSFTCSYGRIMTAEDSQGNTIAKFDIKPFEKCWEKYSFWFPDEPNKVLRLDWTLQRDLSRIYWAEWPKARAKDHIESQDAARQESEVQTKEVLDRILKL